MSSIVKRHSRPALKPFNSPFLMRLKTVRSLTLSLCCTCFTLSRSLMECTSLYFIAVLEMRWCLSPLSIYYSHFICSVNIFIFLQEKGCNWLQFIRPRRKTPGFSHGDRRRVPYLGQGWS